MCGPGRGPFGAAPCPRLAFASHVVAVSSITDRLCRARGRRTAQQAWPAIISSTPVRRAPATTSPPTPDRPGRGDTAQRPPRRPARQVRPPADGQHGAQGELVRRSGAGQPHVAVFRQARGVQPLLFDRHGQQAGARGLDAPTCHQAAWVLESAGVARVQQHPRSQVDGLLRPMHDDDGLGDARQPACPGQAALQRTVQCGVALGQRIAQARPLAQQRGPVRAPPAQRGKAARRHRAVEEVETRRLARRQVRQGRGVDSTA